MELPASSSDINISDVIEVIETESKMEVGRREEPYIKITEQPASKALRFRYECEGRSAGSIPGVNSSPENKTYPTIQIVGHKGRVVVVVSCVTKEGPPFRPHPHNLVGRDGCKKGVCTVEVNNETMTQSFDHLGIQCVKKKDIEEALKAREEIRVDPFRTGFSHRTQPGSIDLNAVRLTFQAFLMDGPNNKFALKPVVSDIIYDKKALCDLAICKLSHCSAPVAGGMEMILLCEKVAKEDISVRFFEERNGKVVWEGSGDFSPTHVHKQVAITFKTPKYKTLQIETPVQVYIQLQRLSDKETSDPLPFQFTPLDSGCSVSSERIRKKPKIVHKMLDAGHNLLQEKDPLCEYSLSIVLLLLDILGDLGRLGVLNTQSLVKTCYFENNGYLNMYKAGLLCLTVKLWGLVSSFVPRFCVKLRIAACPCLYYVNAIKSVLESYKLKIFGNCSTSS